MFLKYMTRDSDRGHTEESSLSKWPEPLALLKERKRETETNDQYWYIETDKT